MTGIFDKLQEILTAVHRLADLEKRHSAAIHELRADCSSLRQTLADLVTRLAVMEAQQSSAREQTISEAKSAAQSAATAAVAMQLMEMGSRLTLLEQGPPPRMRRAIKTPQLPPLSPRR